MIVADSFGELHGCVTALLLASPLYVAVQRYTPTTVGVNDADVALPAARATVDVKTGAAAQVASFGPYRLNVTVPVGLLPPDTVATSLIDVPTGPPAEAAVAIVGTAGPITTDSFAAPHAPVTALLFASPE